VNDAIKEHSKNCSMGATELLFFEEQLLLNEYKLHKAGCLNAYCPHRDYIKEDKIIYLGFGMELIQDDRVIKRVNFYFQINGDSRVFQVNNDSDKFEDAVNGNLKPIF